MNNFLTHLVMHVTKISVNRYEDSVLGSEHFFQNIIPNVWILLAHIFSGIIVVSVIIFLIWRPTRTYIQKRRKLFNQNIKNAEDSKNEAVQHLAEIKKAKIESQKNISELIYRSQKEAEQITSSAINKASNIAKSIRDKAVLEANQIRQNNQKNINESVSALALEIAEKIITKNMNNEINQKFIDEYLNSIN